MKVVTFLLIALIFIMFIPHTEVASASDVVQITGYVYDVEGKPVKGVGVEAFSLAPPWVLYGNPITDFGGHYVLSFDRPKPLDSPRPSNKGLPVYEGCSIRVAWWSEGWLPVTDRIVDTKNRSSIEQNFTLRPAGRMRLKAYSSEGNLIEEFPWDILAENTAFPAYATDLSWRLTRGVFDFDRGTFVLSLNVPHVLNLPWTVPGFGRVILRADNGGKGFALTSQGEMVSINLNYELARTECRLLSESYQKYLDEGYVFPKDLPSSIQSALKFLLKADSMVDDAQKAHFSDLCLNRTLWAAESLELEKAVQDIEKYRKGNSALRIIDENGKPMPYVDVAISQTTHDFLFGVLIEGSIRAAYYNCLKEVGINYEGIQFYWIGIEPSLGLYNLEAEQPISEVERVAKMGIHLGGEGLIILEPGAMSWDTGLVNLSFEELRDKIYEHVYKVVSSCSDYIDYWIVIHGPNVEKNSLGFTREQMIELIKSGVRAIRRADPTSQILVKFDHPCGFADAFSYRAGDEYTLDSYTFISHLNEYGIDHNGIAMGLTYGSLYEWSYATDIGFGSAYTPLPFRDLASISRILDWYGTLSEPIHINEFHAPGNFTSNLGYWHTRSWNEDLQAEWVEKFYTIAFSKPLIKEITYWCAIDQELWKADRGLLDVRYSARESFYALKRLITEDWTTRLHMKTDANGQLEFRGFAGDYNITVSTKDFTVNFTIHLDEQTSNTHTINLGGAIARSKSEQAVTKAGEAVSRAKAEGRTIYLDRAENLLEDARKALIEENYTQAILLAEEAKRSADLAITWLVIPVIIAFAGGILSCSMILYRRAQAKRQKPIAP